MIYELVEFKNEILKDIVKRQQVVKRQYILHSWKVNRKQRSSICRLSNLSLSTTVNSNYTNEVLDKENMFPFESYFYHGFKNHLVLKKKKHKQKQKNKHNTKTLYPLLPLKIGRTEKVNKYCH